MTSLTAKVYKALKNAIEVQEGEYILQFSSLCFECWEKRYPSLVKKCSGPFRIISMLAGVPLATTVHFLSHETQDNFLLIDFTETVLTRILLYYYNIILQSAGNGIL